MRLRLLILLWLTLSLLTAACAAQRSAPSAAPGLSVDRERYASDAQWAPGQLQAHFQKHRNGYRTEQEYDLGARAVIRDGTAFTYVDRESGDRHLGFYEKSSNRFTAMTEDGRRITTHFEPDNGEAYVRQLPQSTYR